MSTVSLNHRASVDEGEIEIEDNLFRDPLINPKSPETRRKRALSFDASFDAKMMTSIDFDNQFDYWYPSWETWEFRRTLSYWVAIMFVEGSALFVIGAAFSMADISKSSHSAAVALVTTPYLVGGICFTLGSYAGFLQVINVHNKETKMSKSDWCFKGSKHWKAMRVHLSWEPLVGYFSYMIGALLFNVNTGLGYSELNPF
jgi:hypothetical protein